MEIWKEINKTEKWKAINIQAITDPNIPINEAGDVLVAEQIAQKKIEARFENRNSDDEDKFPITEGIFTDVWYVMPNTNVALSPPPPSNPIKMNEAAHMAVKMSATTSQHERAVAFHLKFIGDTCNSDIWYTSASRSPPSMTSQNKRAAAYYSDPIDNTYLSDMW